MLVGILFQLPSGLANGGILTFASSTTNDTETTYANGFGAASSLVSVSIGLTWVIVHAGYLSGYLTMLLLPS